MHHGIRVNVNRRLRVAAVVSVACMALLVVPGMALASGTPAPATNSQIVAVHIGGLPPAPALHSPLGPAAASQTASATQCWEWTPYVYITGLTGNNLAHYYEEMYWCENGTNITYHAQHAWGVAEAPGWNWEGNTSTSSAGGSGSSFFRYFAQGKFCFISYLGCVEQWTPWIQITVYGNGGYGWKHS